MLKADYSSLERRVLLQDTKSRVPEGESGDWKVSRFEVSEHEAELFNLRCKINGHYGRQIVPDRYTRLTHKGEVVMSDTPAELRDHAEFVYRAKDHVLINGLGLGAALQCLVDHGLVEHATVVEISEDVINLVGPTFDGDPRVTIVHADAFRWKANPGVRFDAVWHDIWPTICANNLEGMKTLHRRYARKAGWQGSWCRAECERLRDYGY